MKLDSKLFDAIRIRPRHQEEPKVETPPCAWEGCDQAGLYRAPKGHRAEGEYHNFCLEHVRHYNIAFNFFSGMSQDDVEAYVSRAAETDGRPTWGMGAKAGASAQPNHPRNGKAKTYARGERFHDPFQVFARYRRHQNKNGNPQAERRRPMHEPDRRAFEALGLEGGASSEDIKKAYKALVKIHHPDANGGDRSSEDRLRAIIVAYTHLKTTGFVKR
ncbi:DnaJ domain-containing protein [Devosia sp. D6-9]|nr:DnaJ domain-containing protein [Devosia sp. D6-9]